MYINIMCGRYYFDESIDISKILQILEKKYNQSTLDLLSTGEIFPSNVSLVFANNDYQLMKWGYSLNKRNLINTRIETIRDTNIYEDDFQNHKCVVIASGFYEWDKHKKRHYIHTDEDIIYFAGIYQIDNPIYNYSIITTEASSTRNIHNRVPIVLNKNEIDNYLNGKYTIEQLIDLQPVFISEADYEILSLF
ncbi:MAG: SOS response-associated peptidase [Erysipelotrichia bacterium]|nr:SOS response-associated peptidase [Erysipelotrichia bacterium]